MLWKRRTASPESALRSTELVNQEEIIFTPNYTLQSDLKAQLEEMYPFYVYLENEANLAALGEYTFGSISDSVVSLSIHTGIGAGIVENGKN